MALAEPAFLFRPAPCFKAGPDRCDKSARLRWPVPSRDRQRDKAREGIKARAFHPHVRRGHDEAILLGIGWQRTISAGSGGGNAGGGLLGIRYREKLGSGI